ncbi:MAG: hypothetical protein LBC49_01745, partial [Bacteroidales bacterium]|nr:hypothetical protein [Bacteroidales bacterium]
MRKLFLLLAAAALLSASGAQAQRRVPVGDGLNVRTAQEYFVKTVLSTQEANKQDGVASKSVSKDDPRYEWMDTILPTSGYLSSQGYAMFYDGDGIYYSGGGIEDNVIKDLFQCNSFDVLNGTLSSNLLGGDELGQKFTTSTGFYADQLGYSMNEMIVVGAYIRYCRVYSTAWSGWGYNDDNIPSMPFRVKLYGPDNIAQQVFYRQVFQGIINE